VIAIACLGEFAGGTKRILEVSSSVQFSIGCLSIIILTLGTPLPAGCLFDISIKLSTDMNVVLSPVKRFLLWRSLCWKIKSTKA